jgi:acyl-CoA oxidase
MHHYRIPRENMLMRYVKVTAEGKLKKQSEAALKYSYGSMLYIRNMIIQMSSNALAHQLTIVLRYSHVRRQFGPEGTNVENQIIDYQTQQYRLFPIIGGIYALSMVFKKVSQMYSQYITDLEAGKEPLTLLKELHMIAAGMKPYSTWMVTKHSEDMKQCCGGHGFLNIGGLSNIHKGMSGLTTAEGDNTVIIQQTAQSLLKAMKTMAEKKPL